MAPEDIGHRGRWTKSLKAKKENIVFTGNKPIKLLRWLETFCTQCNGNEIPEAVIVSMAPEFLSSPAHESFCAAYSNFAETPRPETFNTWPGAVNCLISSYLTGDVLDEAIANLRYVEHKSTQTVKEYYNVMLSLANDTV